MSCPPVAVRTHEGGTTVAALRPAGATSAPPASQHLWCSFGNHPCLCRPHPKLHPLALSARPLCQAPPATSPWMPGRSPARGVPFPPRPAWQPPQQALPLIRPRGAGLLRRPMARTLSSPARAQHALAPIPRKLTMPGSTRPAARPHTHWPTHLCRPTCRCAAGGPLARRCRAGGSTWHTYRCGGNSLGGVRDGGRGAGSGRARRWSILVSCHTHPSSAPHHALPPSSPSWACRSAEPSRRGARVRNTLPPTHVPAAPARRSAV